MSETLIVSRHQGAIEFVESLGFNGTVVDQFSAEMVTSGMAVVGVLPIHLAAEVLGRGGRFYQIIMPSVPQEMRGQELTPEQMRQYGARLVEVESIVINEVVV